MCVSGCVCVSRTTQRAAYGLFTHFSTNSLSCSTSSIQNGVVAAAHMHKYKWEIVLYIHCIYTWIINNKPFRVLSSFQIGPHMACGYTTDRRCIRAFIRVFIWCVYMRDTRIQDCIYIWVSVCVQMSVWLCIYWTDFVKVPNTRRPKFSIHMSAFAVYNKLHILFVYFLVYRLLTLSVQCELVWLVAGSCIVDGRVCASLFPSIYNLYMRSYVIVCDSIWLC